MTSASVIGGSKLLVINLKEVFFDKSIVLVAGLIQNVALMTAN